MALPWYTHGVSILVPWWCMRFHRIYGTSMELSWRYHGAFMVLQWFHDTPMVVTRQFMGVCVLPLVPWDPRYTRGASMMVPWWCMRFRFFHGTSMGLLL